MATKTTSRKTRKGGKASNKSSRTAATFSTDPNTRIKRVGGKAYDLSDYVKVTTAEGNSSLDNGDATAKALRGMELDEVYKKAAKATGIKEADLRKRYSHLNAGMQRMNLGNRMRAA